jgi:predicted NAD-dependent protein-ADP-ribosyltransferase YbiA (DUF1768 family)
MITRFSGEHAFLSNFYQAYTTIPFQGKALVVPDVEHGFQVLKAALPEEALWVMAAPTAREAKIRGRTITKREAMLRLVLAKFRQNPELRALLAATGDRPLSEGNVWHDNYWGSCGCEKCIRRHMREPDYVLSQNYLGQILMAVRMVLC